MGLSTHVLDNHNGQPAAGMQVELFRVQDGQRTLVSEYTLNKNGRTDQPLFADGALPTGRYQLAFHVAAYFRSRKVELPEPPFLDVVHLDFGVASTDEHYHVPLLVTPWAYSTYRGS